MLTLVDLCERGEKSPDWNSRLAVTSPGWKLWSHSVSAPAILYRISVPWRT
jgi:hypothetical protein